MSEFCVFYSWQSDLPSNTNRGFLEKVLTTAASQMKGDGHQIIVDRDIKGKTGSPDIAESILEKIRSADVFVADLSFVGESTELIEPDIDKKKLIPNPNVMFELGIASECLGWERIILFINEHYGEGDKLPFDIQRNSRTPYVLAPNDDKAAARKQLVSIYKTQLNAILLNIGARDDTSRPILELNWQSAFILEPIEEVHGVIDEKISQAEKHLLELQDDVVTDLSGHTTHMLGGGNNRTLRDYRSHIAQYMDELKKLKSETLSYFISPTKYAAVRLVVKNNGGSPANDSRIIIDLPDWLVISSDIFNTQPLPDPPRIDVAGRQYGYKPRSEFSPKYNCESTSSQVMWTDGQIKITNLPRIFHKDFYETDCTFYLIALQNAPSGVYELPVEFITNEFEDYQHASLLIEVT